ncbi:MAG: flagellar filament capping protein FliD [Lachnospiraceae bacterium]|nr:flagellar filament capping protein FliD [Lachnospiraceae bacterium]
MSDLLRMTGMYSGMDTESIIQQLVSAKATKVTNLKNDQKKLEWKQTLWQDLNKRIYKLYTGTLSNMRLTGSYSKKKSTISDPTKATIVAGDGAVNGVQSLEVKKIAKSGYLTGAVVSKKSSKVTKDTTLSELGVKAGSTLNLTIDGTKLPNGMTVDANDTIDSFIDKFNNFYGSQGVKMSFASGKVTVEGPAGKTFGLSTANATAPTVVGALGLSNCTPTDNVSGTFTGDKIRFPGDNSQVDLTTTLEDLNIKGGKLTVKVGNTTHTIVIDKSKTVNSFMTEFNKQTGLTMSLEHGKISVEAPSGTDFTMTSENDGFSGVTVLAGLGLGDFSGDKQTGKVTGNLVSQLLNASENYQDETTVTLEDLKIGDGELHIKRPGQTDLVVKYDKSMTVEQLMDKFNEENRNNNTGLSMSIEDGKISVNSDASSGKYTLESVQNGTSGNTLLQGLGLEKFEKVEQDGGGASITGDMVSKLNPVLISNDFTMESMLGEIDPSLAGQTISITVGTGLNAKTTQIELTADMKISEFVSKLKDSGVGASFDATNQRFFINSTGTGEAKEFKLTASGGALQSLGLDPDAKYANGSTSTRVYAEDAQIVLNGATFTSDTNTFNVNGLSITTQAVTDEPITITTDTDYDGIYNMIKDFITEYNDIMNEMTKLYNADSARKYTMLSDEEKEAMSDDEVEKWEGTIKDSLLRRDKDLNSVMECMKGAINKGYDIGGETLFLVNFGVGTGSYFDTEKAERNALHIYGDSDDEKYADKDNELKAAISKDPEKVIELFAAMSKDMYDSLHETMGSTDYRSIYKVYDDKRMKIEYDAYTQKIKEEEKKLNAFEDKWYKKFSAMEVALSKLQSSQNSLASMLGQ